MTTLFNAGKLLLLLLLLSVNIIPQFRAGHKELIKMNYMRVYDKTALLGFLQSVDSATVNAALLTVANSGDTSLNSAVRNLSFKKHGEYIAFALGKTGSPADASFLTSKLMENTDDLTASAAYQAIGKTGSEENLSRLIILFLENKLPNTTGFPLALLNFHLRKITSPEIRNTLIRILTGTGVDVKLKAYAMMVLFRTGPRPEDEYFLQQYIIPPPQSDEWDLMLSQYTLGCYVKLKSFPVTESLMLALLSTPWFEIKINGISAISNSMFDGDQKVKIYAEFLKSDNLTVALHAAVNLKNLRFADSLTSAAASAIYQAFLDKPESDPVFKGALLESMMTLFPQNAPNLFKKYRDSVSVTSLASIISGKDYSSPENIKKMIALYDSESPAGKIAITEAVMKLNNDRKTGTEFADLIFSLLDSPLPYISGTVAAGIDSAYAKTNSAKISEILIAASNNQVNNPDFYETFAAYLTLAGMTGDVLVEKLKEIYSTSVISSVRSLAGVQDGTKNNALFELIYNSAFQYSTAEITATAGTFTVKLLPQFAPLSAGNFIYLALTSYFNNLNFHRVVPGFVIQGGDPSGSGWGGPGYDIISEFSPLHYKPMMMGMASAGKDTEGSQWFVTTGNYPHLNWNYTIFGEVVSGFGSVSGTRQGDKIISVKLRN